MATAVRKRRRSAGGRPRPDQAAVPAQTTSAPTSEPTASKAAADRAEADPVIADALQRAADIRDLATWHAEDEAAALIGDARQHAADLRAAAAEQVASMRAVAEQDAVVALKAATESAERLLADAADRSSALLAQAEADQGAAVEARLADRARAEECVRTAEDRVAVIRGRATGDARRILDEVTEEAAVRLRAATADAERIRTTAADEADVIRAEAQTAVSEARAHAEQMVAEVQRLAEEQAARVIAEATRQADHVAGLRRAAADAAYGRALKEAARITDEASAAAAEIAAAHAGLATDLDLTRRQAQLVLDEDLAARRAEIDGEVADHREQAGATRARLERDLAALAEHVERQKQAAEARIAGETDRLRTVAEQAARQDAAAITGEAQELREAAQAELAAARRASRKADKRAAALRSKVTRAQRFKAVCLWLGLAAGIVLTASGEWAFASLVGLGKTPLGDAGWALPVGLDIYAVIAFRMKRDIPFALGLMGVTNVTFHVADMTGLGIVIKDGERHPTVPLIVIAVLIVVGVVWRIHQLVEGDHTGTGTSAELDPESGTDPVDDGDTDAEPGDGTALREGAAYPGTPDVRVREYAAGQSTYNASDVPPADTGADGPGTTLARTPARTPRQTPVQTRTRKPRRTPARTGEADLLADVRALPRSTDGYVNVTRARNDLDINRDRAVRLLDTAGLLRPEDALKYQDVLVRTPRTG
ncbi:hypothetical protein [Streptomyces sp. NPDC001389]|uniref:hypothetical protein n=1 Tax=Streptomyces sp. NPDC001389 TaxID=3364569 RepID=UPI0036A117D5